jgi:hypothetical protein
VLLLSGYNRVGEGSRRQWIKWRNATGTLSSGDRDGRLEESKIGPVDRFKLGSRFGTNSCR